MDDDSRREQGMTVRRAVLGDAHVDRSIQNTTEFTAPFQDWITRYAWGEIWSRPGLSRPERSIAVLTVGLLRFDIRMQGDGETVFFDL
jgi:alkylhydroperoxidase/carboxymuconolactone decarboxylase family protein YurZ